jgi:hypothetical protein
MAGARLKIKRKVLYLHALLINNQRFIPHDEKIIRPGNGPDRYVKHLFFPGETLRIRAVYGTVKSAGS